MNAPAGIPTSLVALADAIRTFNDVRPLPGFTAEEAGHSDDPGHAFPFRTHRLSVRVGFLDYELALGAKGGADVTLPATVRALWLGKAPKERETFLQLATIEFLRREAVRIATQLWTADLGRDWTLAQARFEAMTTIETKRTG